MHSSRALFSAAAVGLVAGCGDASTSVGEAYVAGKRAQVGTPAPGTASSGKYALAFEKVSLEGDERSKPLLLQRPTAATRMTNTK